MTDSGLDRLATLLAAVGGHGTFSASRTAGVGDLRIRVQGLGDLDLPVSDEQAGNMCALGQPARYGRGEETLLDRDVRRTWEIPRSRVKIDGKRWSATLQPVVGKLSRDLGIPDDLEVQPVFHSMLVYAPGDFFVPHQDSEKEDGMIASLVVTLPSRFTGGTLRVDHGNTAKRYRGSRTSLSFVAFFSDCRHSIEPVTSGHRVVLTYDLVLRSGPGAPLDLDQDPRLAEDVARCLDGHFAGEADRLIYLLDHEYTPSGLSVSYLKGVDAARVGVLRNAAALAGCEARWPWLISTRHGVPPSPRGGLRIGGGHVRAQRTTRTTTTRIATVTTSSTS